MQSNEDIRTSTSKFDKTHPSPRQQLRHCSYQSGGGLVTVNFVGVTKKDLRTLKNTSKSSSNLDIKYALTNIFSKIYFKIIQWFYHLLSFSIDIDCSNNVISQNA